MSSDNLPIPDNGASPACLAEADSIPPISEKQLALLWQRRASRSQALRTERGSRIRVLYPGRPGVTAGPDFRDALLLVEEQGLVQGDVEIHLRQQDWQSHGHHDDPNYNGVALHVALESGGPPSWTASGGLPPLVELRDLVQDPTGPGTADDTRDHLWRLLEKHGYRRPDSAERMAALLNRAGDERFLQRSQALQRLMSEQPPAQTLWESICEALGYRHNQHAFLQLAGVAPIDVLEKTARRLPEGNRGAELASILLGLAGFGESARQGLPPFGTALDASQWKLFRVRPPNHPRRRVVGAAHLVARHTHGGLWRGLANAASSGNPTVLTKALTVDSNASGEPALVGPGRARDIAVNAVLPLLHGWHNLAGHAPNSNAMLDCYRKFGRLTENEITRELAQTLQLPEWGRVARNARQQQGLIHLQRLLAGAAAPQSPRGRH